MPRKVMITGAGGFAGAYLAPLLADAGYHVVGLVNGRADSARNGISELYQLDLRNLNAVKSAVLEIRPSHVVHLAAISFVAHENISELYETNIVGTKNLLVSLSELAEKPQAVLLASSANVYGNVGNADLSPLKEVDPINPPNDYAISKIAMEYLARQFYDRLNIIIARPFNYTGRGQSENFIVPKIVKHFRDRIPSIELGNIDISRDFTDVRATVQYFRLMMECPDAVGRIYNICSGLSLSLKYILSECERLTGHSMDVKINPAFVRANELKCLVGSPQKLHDEIGRVGAYPFERTLQWMLEA